MSRRAPRGFTLMETLVMLVLVSFAVLLMFQMLGSYRIARERVMAQTGGIDRQALFDAWFRDSVHGLFPPQGVDFTGTDATFSGVSLNPLFEGRGVPVAVAWTLDRDGATGWEVRYAEEGRQRFALPLAGEGAPHFSYFDAAGEVHDKWPPALGKVSALPASVAIVREGADGTRTLLASVRGDLDPFYAPFELWEDE